jgi:hypothetical protein
MTEIKPLWNLSNNNIVVRFPPLAGGKFLISLLSFYNSFMFPVPLLFNRELIQAPTTAAIKELSHFYIPTSIPPKEVRSYWDRYEVYMIGFWRFRLSALIGSNAESIEDTNLLIHTRVHDILQDYKCFHVTHIGTREEILSILPNAIIVNLIDYELIQQVSSKFKIHHSNSQRHTTKLALADNVINFSMRHIFNKSKFLSEVEELAFRISGDKSVHPGIEEYYDKYKAVHL